MARISKGELKRRARAEREANHQASRESKQREALNKMTLGLARSEITDEDRARAAKSTLPKSPVRFVDDETRFALHPAAPDCSRFDSLWWLRQQSRSCPRGMC